jgi:amidase
MLRKLTSSGVSIGSESFEYRMAMRAGAIFRRRGADRIEANQSGAGRYVSFWNQGGRDNERVEMARFAEYGHYDALGLAELVASGDVSAAELINEAIARIEAVNPRLNAVITRMDNQARSAAAVPQSGPLRGVPFLMKDLSQAVAGVPFSQGSLFLKDYVPTEDSELTRRLKAAGLILIGKTNTPEFGLSPVTEPLAFGPTLNPWDSDRTPGGSSGGSAAAVAARIVPMAHGSDGGGSIRIPASCCGLFGLKPTRGRNPLGPDNVDVWLGASVDHVVTRSVRDSAAMLDATAGPEPGAVYVAPERRRSYLEEVGVPPGRLRIAVSTVPWLGTTVAGDCVEAVARAAKLLGDLGHVVEEASPTVDRERLLEAFVVMAAAETRRDILALAAKIDRKPERRSFETETWLLYLLGRRFPADEYVAALRTLRSVGVEMARFFANFDVLLTPTLAAPPLPIGALRAKGRDAVLEELLASAGSGRLVKGALGFDRSVQAIFDFIPFTPLFNLSGQPAMSVPLEWTTTGLPIGLQFVGRFGDEATLFRLAAQLEQARPWAQRVPPICG